MANIDGNMILSEDQAIDAASKNSNAVYIGSGRAYNPCIVDVKLTTKMTSGTIDSIKLQTATDADFTTPIDLCTYVIGSGISQSKPNALAQFAVPYEHKDYVRLVYASTNPVGGKVFASINKDVKIG